MTVFIPNFLTPQLLTFGEMDVLSTSEANISTQTVYQPLQIQKVSELAEVIGENHFWMTTRGLRELCKMLEVNPFDSAHSEHELGMG